MSLIDTVKTAVVGSGTVWIAVGGASLALMVTAGIAWYGHHQYSAGYAQAVLEARAAATALSEQYRAQEAAAQSDVDANYAKYRGQILATENRTAALDTAAAGLRGQLEKLRTSRAAAPARAAGGSDAGAGPDFIGVIAACAGRYDDVAKYAAGLVDQVTGLQGYVGAIQPR